jgi:hypothetical protein
MKKLISLVSFIVLLGITANLTAQTTRTWVGITNAWNTAGNWSPSGVPGAGDNIVINGGTPTLDANRSVTNITVTGGTTNLNGFTLTVTGSTSLTAGTVNSGTISFSNTTTTFAGTTFGSTVTVSAQNISFNGSTFNGNVTATKTASGTNTSTGANTFNGTLDLRVNSGQMDLSPSGATKNAINNNLLVSTTGSGILVFGGTGNRLASGKTVTIGGGGWAGGTLKFTAFEQLGTTSQTLTLTGTTTIVEFGTGNNWAGKLTVSAPIIKFNGATFSKKVIATKSGSGDAVSSGGNTFSDTLDLRVTSGNLYMHDATANDAFNSLVFVSNTSSGGIYFGYTSTGTGTLASGKTISVGTSGFASGTLGFKRFTQSGTTSQTITLTGTTTAVEFGANNSWAGKMTVSAPIVRFNGATFSKKVIATKSGSGDAICSGGNTFSDTLDLRQSAGQWFMHNSTANDAFNSYVFVSNTGSGGIYFGNSSTGTGTLATGKTITVGTNGFSNGTLGLRRFTQTGSTAQSITLTGTTTTLAIGGTDASGLVTWNGSITTSSANITVANSTCNGKAVFTKTGTSSSTFRGGNTFNDSLRVNVTSSGYIVLGGTSGDTYNSGVKFYLTSSGTIFPSSAGTNTYKGNIFLATNNVAIAFGNGAGSVIFNGTNSQAITKTGTGKISIRNITMNKASQHLTTHTPLSFENVTLTSGKIIGNSTTDTLNIGSVPPAGSASSYIDGVVRVEADSYTSYSLPIGSGSIFQPITIALSSAPSKLAYSARYYPTGQTQGSSADTSVANLSNCEHWKINQVAGTATAANITLGWKSTSCNGAKPTNMRVARWSGSQWVNVGNGANTGNNTAGTVRTTSTQSSLGYFTLCNKNCTSSDSAYITANGLLQFWTGNEVLLTAHPGKYYKWESNGFSQSYSATSTGTYSVIIKDTLGCIVKDSVDVTVWQKPWWVHAIKNPTVSIKQIADSAEAWITNHPDTIFAEDELYSRFYKWKDFWQSRMSSSTASITDINGKYLQVLQTIEDCEDGNWSFIGPNSSQFSANNQDFQKIGWVNTIWVVPGTSNSTLYIGTPMGGIWKTTNAMEVNNNPTWTCLTCNSNFANLGVTSIVSSNNGQKIYAATGKYYGLGIIQSIDGGDNWEIATDPFDFPLTSGKIVTKLIINPINNNVIFAITRNEVWMTSNGGTTWNNLNLTMATTPIDPAPELVDIEFIPGGGQQDVIVGGPRVLYTYISGTWSSNKAPNLTSNSILPEGLKIDVNSTAIYVGYSFTNSGGVLIDKSVDNANTFDNIGSSINLDLSNFEVNTLNENFVYSEGGVSFNRLVIKSSIIGTVSIFQECTRRYASDANPSTHCDIRCINLIESTVDGDEDIVFVGTDGGILMGKTSDGNGKTEFKNITGTGLNITMFYDIDSPESTPQYVAGGTQDNDIFVGIAGGNFDDRPTGKNWPLSDSYQTEFNRLDPSRFYVESGGGDHRWIDKMLITGEYATTPSYPNPHLYLQSKTQLRIDCNNNLYYPRGPVTIIGPSYFAQDRLYRYSFLDNSKTSISTELVTPICKRIRTFNIAESDPNIVFIGYDQPTWNQDLGDCIECSGSCTFCSDNPDDLTPTEPCLSKRLYKSVNAMSTTPTWEDLTPNISHGRGGPDGFRTTSITDIAIDFNNPDKVWISFDGFKEYDNGTPRSRVAYSDDGGDTWDEYSAGLPNVPINCLTIEPGSDTRIWAGTDVGVYYRDTQDGTNVWHCYSEGLPLTYVFGIDIVKCINKVRIATHGFGLWEADLPLETNNDIVISTNTTWNNSKQIFNNVTVENGATLTIASGKIIQFHKDHKIIVKPGGKLVVDGAVLTNLCEGMWPGVEVWGDRDLSQSSSNQGTVEVKNGGTIENAITAINAIKLQDNGLIEGDSWDFCGGIVKVDDGIFKNNKHAINIHTYHAPMVSGNEPANKSYIKNSTFEIDDDWNPSWGLPYEFIGFYDIRGLKILGNEFKNSNTTGLFGTGLNMGGIAVNALEASTFKLTPICATGTIYDPCTVVTPSTIDNMPIGVKISNTTGLGLSANIHGNEFTNNYIGVLSVGSDAASITKNQFYLVEDETDNDWGKPVGIKLDGNNTYKIEENDFSRVGDDAGKPTRGVLVANSGDQSNQVFKNTFTDLKYGTYSYGDNRNEFQPYGLCYICNTFNLGEYDMYVQPESGEFNQGISMTQVGLNPLSPADNLFSRNNISPETDVKNNAALFNYRFNQTAFSTTTNRVKPYETTGIGPVDFTGIQVLGGTLNCTSSSSVKGTLRTNISTNTGLKRTAQHVADSLVDHGNTTLLKNRMDTTTVAGSNNLKNLLLGYSPWLSYDVVYKTATMVNLSNSQVFTVLYANAHSGRSDLIIDVLEKRTPPMPDSLINILLNNTDSISVRDTLFNRISALRGQHKFLTNQLVELHLNDTTYNGIDSAIVALRPHRELWSSYKLVALYDEREWPDSARRLVDSIPHYYNLKGSDLTNYNDFRYIYRKADSLNVFKNLYRWHNLDSLSIVRLKAMAGSNPYQPGKQACNILMFIGADTCDTEIPNEIAPRYSGTNDPSLTTILFDRKEDVGFKVYPNPTTGDFNIRYSLPESRENATLEVYNLLGAVVYKQNLASKQGVLALNINLTSGMYLIVIKDNRLILTEKLIVN